MSQSPVDPAADPASGQTIRYRQGWKALNRLLHNDRSFSGYERNNAFLNCGGQGFADISAASGFDFPDDTRAVVTSDWDFDGDLDVWVTCRTAPRLRLLQNRADTASTTWLAVRPEGDGLTTNRDAIGATVRVWLEGNPAPLTRSVHGGDSFLSQSGSWLHFGLGSDAAVERVEIQWPGGRLQTVDGISAGGFYRISQGVPAAARWSPPPGRSGLAAAPQNPLPDEASARIILPARLPVPPVGALASLRGPLLLNIWSATCPACLAELSEWAEERETLRGAGLAVLAWNTDPEPPDTTAYPFEHAAASPEVLRALDLFQRAVLDRWTPLPVPCSFLLDGEGRVAAIYKGRVSAGQVAADSRLLAAPPAAWRSAALPFPGRFIGPPPQPEPLRVSSQFIDAAQAGDGLDYLEAYAAKYGARPDTQKVIDLLRQELAPAADPGTELLAEADAQMAAGDAAAAVASYKNVLRQSPKTLAAAERLAWILAAHGDEALRRPEEALALAERLCALTNNQNPAYLDLRGAAQAAAGDFAAAQESAESAIALLGDSPAGEQVRSRLQLYASGKPFRL